MIGASASVLMATTTLALWHPARCWVAPLIPVDQVEVRRDPGPGLSDLLGVGAPPQAGHRARHAHRRAEELGELVERGEVLRAAHAASAADHDARVGERDPAGAPGPLADPDREVGVHELGVEVLDDGQCSARRRSRPRRRRRRRVSRARGVESDRVLDQAAGPALAAQREHARRARGRREAVGHHRQTAQRAGVGEHLVAAVRARRDDRARRRGVRRAGSARGPTRPARRRRSPSRAPRGCVVTPKAPSEVTTRVGRVADDRGLERDSIECGEGSRDAERAP